MFGHTYLFCTKTFMLRRTIFFFWGGGYPTATNCGMMTHQGQTVNKHCQPYPIHSSNIFTSAHYFAAPSIWQVD